MANNYTEAADVLAMPREAAEYAVALDAAVTDLTFGPEPLEAEILPHVLGDAKEIAKDRDWGSSATFEAGDNGLYVASDESIDLEVTADIVQAALRRFNVPGPCYLEWASRRDKMRAGEFGGGAVVITKDEQRWMSSSQWVHETILEIATEAALDAGFESA